MARFIYARDGRAMVHTDTKRYWWLLSVLYPLSPLFGIALHVETGWVLALVSPVLASYFVGPLLDAWLGEDAENPPPEAVAAMEQDSFYKVLPLITVPLHVVSLVLAVAYAATAELTHAGYFGLALTAGLAAGLAINTAHELGHKPSWLEQWAARVALAVPAYGHFCVEHNRGHHRDVATPEDPASARMGESIYAFVLREIPGAISRGIEAERERLAKLGVPFWSWRNVILQSYAMTGCVARRFNRNVRARRHRVSRRAQPVCVVAADQRELR